MKKPRTTGANKKIGKYRKIRIIGGQWRGRKIFVPTTPGMRPTTNRVRETLFNWLAPVIHGARCLDCFAGSGALSIEALSRYASSATLLEHERIAINQLKKNLELLEGYGKVINTNALTWLSGKGKPFNVVFLDPPFYQGLLAKAIALLERRGWLSDKSWVYLESEANNPLTEIPDNWQLYREKISGQVAYRMYIRLQEKFNNFN